MDVDYTGLGRLLASPARSRIVGILLDGGPLSASELARRAGVAPSTASEHLRALVDGGLLVQSPRGRHRDFSIARAEVAEALEALSRICPTVETRSLRGSSEARALHAARTCYDHLAGVLGVEVFEAMLGAGWLEGDADACVLGPSAASGFASLGVDLGAVRASRRPPIRLCLDWTVRRPHLGGGLGAAVCSSLLGRGWITRAERRRGVVVTAAGKEGLREVFGLAAGAAGGS